LVVETRKAEAENECKSGKRKLKEDVIDVRIDISADFMILRIALE
jgi:hypothetical protein